MEKCKRSGILFVLFVFAILAVMTTPGVGEAAGRKLIKLRVVAGHPLAKGTFWIQSLENFFCREVEKRVLEETENYKVECKGFYGGSVAKLGEVFETVESGLADIGHILALAEMAKIDPYNLTFWVPFSTGDMEVALKAYSKTVDHIPIFDELLAKYNQRRIGHAYTLQDSYQIISNVPIKTMEDMKGVKLAHAGSFLPMIAALGATPVQAVYTEIYTSMDTGVFNGFTMPATSAVAFRIHEVGKYFIKPDLGAMIAGLLTINAKKMKKLPKEVQDILLEVGNEYSYDMLKRARAFEGEALAAMEKAGVEIYTLPKQEKARWANKINDAGILAKSMRSCNSKGMPCSEIAKFYVQALEEEGYKFPYKPILE